MLRASLSNFAWTQAATRVAGSISVAFVAILLLSACTGTLDVARKNADGTVSSHALRWGACSGRAQRPCETALEHVERALGSAATLPKEEAPTYAAEEMQEAAVDLDLAVTLAEREDEAHGNRVTSGQVAYDQSLFYELNGQLCDGFAKSAAERAHRANPIGLYDARIKQVEEQMTRICPKTNEGSPAPVSPSR